VNPLQFNNSGDLEKYPRTFEKDLDLLKEIGVDYVFAPTDEAMYQSSPVVTISFGELGNKMEGAFRPGHFDGVGVVVSKLFHLCNPTNAYFGLKDLQQYLLIRRMVSDLSFPVNIIGMPIVREASGLAMSSRNSRLSHTGKQVASNIYKGLTNAKAIWLRNNDPEETKNAAIAFYESIGALELEYFQVVDPNSLEEIARKPVQEVAFCVAGYVEGVRLIDNLYLRQD